MSAERYRPVRRFAASSSLPCAVTCRIPRRTAAEKGKNPSANRNSTALVMRIQPSFSSPSSKEFPIMMTKSKGTNAMRKKTV